MIDYELIGNKVKLLRIKQNLTQDQLAEMIDITTVYLSRIENGHAKPSLEIYSSLCQALHCDLSYIFGGVTVEAPDYQCEKVLELFHSCAPKVKTVALNLLRDLSKLQ